ncbi:MAG: hypothetical protein IE928_06440 [Gammaproteobacteria bacterium]|nr:hypothetical protein [Gammaproteobacteria bacterium]
MELKVYKQKDLDENVFNKVEEVGKQIYDYCTQESTSNAFKEANKPGASSSLVQNVILNKAKELGFQSEKKGLFGDIPTSNLRPDYFLKIGRSGVIVEVERGKTIMNNMDILDMWKCHLCSHANHLFLFVPLELKHNTSARGYNPYNAVCNRMQPFFNLSNYTNVHSLWIFGY